MKKIAITGGIGSGKTSVSKYYQSLGFPVYSCDEIYNEIIEQPSYIESIQKIFPNVIIDGKIDRKRLADKVFTDEQARNALNQLAHPLIMDVLYEHISKTDSAYIFAEIPLLFELGREHDFDEIIIVERDEEARLQSVMQRDKSSEDRVEKRIHAQNRLHNWIENKKNLPNVHFLKNDGDLSSLYQKAKEILSLIKNKS